MATLNDVFEQLEKDINLSINESITQVDFACNCSPTSSIAFLFTTTLKQQLEKNISIGVNQYIANHNNFIFQKDKIKQYAEKQVHKSIDEASSPPEDQDIPFKIIDGIPEPPKFYFDNGFLDDYKKRAPTYKDKLKYYYWEKKAKIARVLREDLDDALDAYEHFLGATGFPLEFNLEKYIKEDTSGKQLLSASKSETKKAVKKLIKKSGNYTISSSGFSTRTKPKKNNGFPYTKYPVTENWQKAIGGFSFWISATIVASEANDLITYKVAMTIHAEDKYNFNPGQKDIATGTPDSANGLFEITGLAKQFMQYGSHTVKIQWSEPAPKNNQ